MADRGEGVLCLPRLFDFIFVKCLRMIDNRKRFYWFRIQNTPTCKTRPAEKVLRRTRFMCFKAFKRIFQYAWRSIGRSSKWSYSSAESAESVS